MTPHGPTLHDHPRHTLRQIVAAYGPDILRDVRRTRALLKDLCSAHQAEINLLVMALQANVPAGWVAELGELEVRMGNSSRDIRVRAGFTVR